MPSKHQLALSVQYPDPQLKLILPRPLVRRWVQAALLAPAELTIRFANATEARDLNRDYRGKDYATNVLTFAYTDAGTNEVTQADIILCCDVVQREAAEQAKSITAHAAHLVVHGVLHAQGYEHETADEAEEMQQLEITILAALGFPDPYASRA